MRSYNHVTPQYVCNRLTLFAYERKHPDQPWLTRDMINILATWFQPTDIGLEFWSGRSTKWFASRVKHLTSVEHNPEWYAKVKRDLSDIKNVDYFLHEDGSLNADDTEYVAVANKLPNECLDFCLIDGMAREFCSLASLDKLKRGGILIIDNANWYIPREKKSPAPNSRGLEDGYASPEWQKVGELLKDWRYIWTTNGVTDTALWVKP